MNRPIEYRAWDKETKQMCDIWNLFFKPKKSASILVSEDDGQDCDLHRKDISCIDIMQYTGLKDKHDKKIFESDIVKAYVSYGWTHSEGTLYRDEIFIVKWYDSQGRFSFYNNNTYYYINIGKNHVEVTGNLYETPELLKETDND